jgi:hypothetical protein
MQEICNICAQTISVADFGAVYDHEKDDRIAISNSH